MTAKTPLRIAVLISGTGSTLENLFQRIEAGTLPAKVELVVSSRPEVLGLERKETSFCREYPACGIFPAKRSLLVDRSDRPSRGTQDEKAHVPMGAGRPVRRQLADSPWRGSRGGRP